MRDDTVTVIEARPLGLLNRVRAAWAFRHYYPVLFKELAMRRFRNTILGYWWLIIRPLAPMVVLIFTFTYFVQVDTGTLPYPIFLVAGYVAWNLFMSTVVFMTRSLMWTRSLMRKIYLPKMIVPPAAIGPPLVELVVMLLAFAVIVAWSHFSDGVPDVHWGWHFVLVPVCLVLVLVLAIAIGAVFSVLALLARDIIFTIGWVLQFLMFATPVVYPLSQVPEGAQWVFRVFNPMTGLVETTRWALTGSGTFEPLWFVVTVVQVALVTLLCMTFFSRAEAYLSDVV